MNDLAPVAEALPADRSPAWVYLARLDPGSFRAQRGALDSMARRLTGGAAGMRELPWWSVRYQHAAALRSWLATEYAPKTANRYLSALRGVTREAWMLGLMPAEDAARIRAVRNLVEDGAPAGRSMTPEELRRLFAEANPREGAILALLYGAGLRRAESVALAYPADIELPTLHVRKGKGRKARDVAVAAWARRRLDAWIVTRGTWEGPFLTGYRGGRVVFAPIGTNSVYDALRRLAHRSDVVLRFCPHDLRRSYIGDMLEAGAELVHVQKLAGHADPKTTASYDRRPEAARAAAAERLPDPTTAAGGSGRSP